MKMGVTGQRRRSGAESALYLGNKVPGGKVLLTNHAAFSKLESRPGWFIHILVAYSCALEQAACCKSFPVASNTLASGDRNRCLTVR